MVNPNERSQILHENIVLSDLLLVSDVKTYLLEYLQICNSYWLTQIGKLQP